MNEDTTTAEFALRPTPSVPLLLEKPLWVGHGIVDKLQDLILFNMVEMVLEQDT